jgi:hypothetical protein
VLQGAQINRLARHRGGRTAAFRQRIGRQHFENCKWRG